jgi:hypothetical protein
MKRPWFSTWGWIYRPIRLQGGIVVLPAQAFCVPVFLAVDRHSHSASDTLYGIFSLVAPAIGIGGWTASRTCERPATRG